MLEREARPAEGDLAVLPLDVTGKLAVADGRRGRRPLPHPGEQRGDRMGLGRQTALAGEIWPGLDTAVEAGGNGGRIETKHESGRALLTEVGERSEPEAEIDG